MRYSLLSRFQGAFWGATVGEELGCYVEAMEVQRQVIDLNRWQPGKLALQPKSDLATPGKLAIARTLDLIHQRPLTLDLPVPSPNLKDVSPVQNMMTGARRAIASLPVVLFHHESEIRLHKSLSTIHNPAELNESLIWGFTIAQLLRERFKPTQHIPDTIAYLQRSQNDDQSRVQIQQLEHLQCCLNEGAIASVDHSLPATALQALALALECFLQTPDDLPLALLRAARISYSPAVCALVGALAGAHNSIAGFPAQWALSWTNAEFISAWGISGLELNQLAAELLAVWSGAYPGASTGISSVAIAAPGMIRPR